MQSFSALRYLGGSGGGSEVMRSAPFFFLSVQLMHNSSWAIHGGMVMGCANVYLCPQIATESVENFSKFLLPPGVRGGQRSAGSQNVPKNDVFSIFLQNGLT